MIGANILHRVSDGVFLVAASRTMLAPLFLLFTGWPPVAGMATSPKEVPATPSETVHIGTTHPVGNSGPSEHERPDAGVAANRQ